MSNSSKPVVGWLTQWCAGCCQLIWLQVVVGVRSIPRVFHPRWIIRYPRHTPFWRNAGAQEGECNCSSTFQAFLYVLFTKVSHMFVPMIKEVGSILCPQWEKEESGCLLNNSPNHHSHIEHILHKWLLVSNLAHNIRHNPKCDPNCGHLWQNSIKQYSCHIIGDDKPKGMRIFYMEVSSKVSIMLQHDSWVNFWLRQGGKMGGKEMERKKGAERRTERASRNRFSSTAG